MHLQMHCLRGQVLNAWWRPNVLSRGWPSETLMAEDQIKGNTRGDAGYFGCPGLWSIGCTLTVVVTSFMKFRHLQGPAAGRDVVLDVLSATHAQVDESGNRRGDHQCKFTSVPVKPELVKPLSLA